MKLLSFKITTSTNQKTSALQNVESLLVGDDDAVYALKLEQVTA